MISNPCSIVVLISGNGSNLQALIDQADGYGYRIGGVISNNPAAYGLQRAAKAGIPAKIIEHGGFPDRESFDMALLEQIEKISPDLIVLAGFMRILGTAFVRRQAGRILNIHPSLLPKYPGMHTHRRVLAAGDNEHGASVHFVNEELDGGPIVARGRITVRDDDTEASLAARVRRLEHDLYPRVAGWFASGRLRSGNNAVYMDEERLPATGMNSPAPAGA